MKVRLVAADLDGTLLTDDKRLTERTRRAITGFRNAGGVFCLASGRCGAALRPVRDMIPEAEYAIEANGAIVRHSATDRILSRKSLPFGTMKALLPVLEEIGVPYDLFSGGDGYTQERFYDRIAGYLRERTTSDIFIRTRKKTGSYDAFFEGGGQPVEKISLFFEDEKKRVAAAGRLSAIPGIFVTSSLTLNLEIMDEAATKGNAVLALAKELGIPANETAAFGDNDNDASMLEAAGIGVAMENAVPGLKRVADRIAPSNERDGVAQILEEWMED